MDQKIGIIGAMETEVKLLISQLTDREETQTAGITFYEGKLMGKPAVVAQCGIGKVFAAMCTQAMIDKYCVDAVINTGVAGGLHHSLAVGDIVIGVDAVQHDFDLSPFGYVKGYLGGATGGDGSAPTQFHADKELVQRFKAAADKVLTENKYIEGTIASGDVFVNDRDLKKELISSFGAAAAEMEGASIAQVASANQVPFIILRSISDLAEGGANVTFAEFERDAAEVSANIVLKMLELS